jgi:hypothetical protein
MSSLPSMTRSMARCEPSTPVQNAETSLSSGTNLTDSAPPLADLDLDWLFSTALSRCGLTHADACELMKLDPSQWAKQIKSRDNAQVSFQRLTKLPARFWFEFMALLGQRLGVKVTHFTIEEEAALHLGDIVQAFMRVMVQQSTTMRRAG